MLECMFYYYSRHMIFVNINICDFRKFGINAAGMGDGIACLLCVQRFIILPYLA